MWCANFSQTARVHTNSAVGAIDRLADFGVPAFLLAATLRGVLSQRLVRRLCPDCAVPDPDAEIALAKFAAARDDCRMPVQALRATGCGACGGSGYRGRIVIGELLEFSPEILQLVASGARQDAISAAARKEGMEKIIACGLRLVDAGTTSIPEVFQVVDW